MSNARIINIMAGFMIIMSLLLSQIHHPYWLFLTLFVGVNLFQSGFTKFCLADIILNKIRS